jgi:hypothetical protein
MGLLLDPIVALRPFDFRANSMARMPEFGKPRSRVT